MQGGTSPAAEPLRALRGAVTSRLALPALEERYLRAAAVLAMAQPSLSPGVGSMLTTAAAQFLAPATSLPTSSILDPGEEGEAAAAAQAGGELECMLDATNHDLLQCLCAVPLER